MAVDWTKLTDHEILQLKELYRQREVDELVLGLLQPKKKNPNYRLLFECITQQQYDNTGELVSGKRGAGLEGSSRSGKTWGGIDIIMLLTQHVHKDTGCTINIYRETYNEFKTTLYEDFKRRLDDFNLPNPFHNAKEIKSFRIGKSTIYFLGDGKHGGGCDYAFYNEVMFIQKHVFDQSEMRCRKFWWADYNPSVTDHWFFDNVLPRQDVGHIRTTYEDNIEYISPQELSKIRSYEPWEPDTYIVADNQIWYDGKVVDKSNQPPPHIKNIEAGTSDEFMWKVYGLGLRGAMKGVIFQHVNWIDKWPEHVDDHIYTNDFGFTTDPNSLNKYAEDETDIWIEPMCYEPIETDHELSDFMDAAGVDRKKLIICDSSDKYTGENKGTVEMVKGLVSKGWKAVKVSKTKSNMYWINSMKTKRLNIVKNRFYPQVKKEQENYRMKEIGGISINQPIDKYNHFWDSSKYGHIAMNCKGQTYQTSKQNLNKISY